VDDFRSARKYFMGISQLFCARKLSSLLIPAFKSPHSHVK
jgi:hypothetical protein